MKMTFRAVLILISIGTFIYMMKKIRNSKLQIEATIFWVVFSMILVVFSVFPSLPDLMAKVLGIYSTPNFLFLFFIFLLIVKLFSMSIQLSRQEDKIKSLVQELAIKQQEKESSND